MPVRSSGGAVGAVSRSQARVSTGARPQRDTAEGVRVDSDGRRPALPAGRDDGHRRDVLATGVHRPNRLRHRREVDRVQREDAGRPDLGGPAGQLRAPTARASAETTMMLRATVTTGTSHGSSLAGST